MDDGAPSSRLDFFSLVMQSRAERKPLEESPDTAERGGRESDPAKAAGQCHRKEPPKRGRSRDVLAGKGEKVR